MLDVNATQQFVRDDKWRGNRAAVALLTFDVDGDTPLLAEDIHYVQHLSTMSHGAYGPKVGIFRIIKMLERQSKPATFFFPGLTAERYPQAIEAVLEAGHEVALHGYTHKSPVYNTPEQQIDELERGLEVLAKFGVEPKGYRAPMWSTSKVTMEMLGRYRMVYDSSMFDDDRPYVLETPSGRLAELPIHWALDDWEQYIYVPDPDFGHIINRPSQVAELWIEELDAMRTTNSLCILTCHPFCSGRPSRIRAIERFVEFAESCGDIAFSRADRMAEAVLASQVMSSSKP